MVKEIFVGDILKVPKGKDDIQVYTRTIIVKGHETETITMTSYDKESLSIGDGKGKIQTKEE